MQLVSFSVTNYRSITSAYKLPIRQTTILVGPNNEGKSNILKALVTALEILGGLGAARLYRGRFRHSYRQSAEGYDWAKDYPVALQDSKPNGESIFNLSFRLNDDEISDFKKEVGSSRDGTLPIQLTIGHSDPSFKVLKKGPGAAALSKKVALIAQFIAKRVNITYIPAVRTSEEARNIVASIVDRELAVVEREEGFQKALDKIAEIQKPILNQISRNTRESLKEFLPNTKDVMVEISEEARFRALRRSYEIKVDDGTLTLLERKGDGVQSLAALGLMRHASESSAIGKQLILAIEEPESHLHPSTIHTLKRTLSEIGIKHQVVMTTHCPIFVDRVSIKSNIIVQKNKAQPAKSVKEIRETLGVRAADNLQHADVVLVVEGGEDKKALTALIKHASAALNAALTNQTLVLDSLLGGSNLSYKLSLIRESMCGAYCFLDHDKCGLESADRAEKEALLALSDITFATCDGLKESEIEDLYDESVYATMLQNKYGVSTMSPKFKGTNKWSDRAREAFKHQGKPWSDQLEAKVKADIAELVASSPSSALNSHKRSSFDALVTALENKLIAIVTARK